MKKQKKNMILSRFVIRLFVAECQHPGEFLDVLLECYLGSFSPLFCTDGGLKEKSLLHLPVPIIARCCRGFVIAAEDL